MVGGPRQAAAGASRQLAILGLGFSGYYLASFLDFAGLAYVTASFERLVLYLDPTMVLLLGWAVRPPCHRPAADRAAVS